MCDFDCDKATKKIIKHSFHMYVPDYNNNMASIGKKDVFKDNLKINRDRP